MKAVRADEVQKRVRPEAPGTILQDPRDSDVEVSELLKGRSREVCLGVRSS